MSSRSWWIGAMAASAVAVTSSSSCNKTQTSGQAPPPAGGAEQILANALYAQGGLAKLKSASSFTARVVGNHLGTAINGTLQHKAGALRLEYLAQPSRDPAVLVAAEESCWQRIGRAVLPCRKELATHTTRLARLLRASWLWPLKEARGALKVKPAAGSDSADGLAVSAGGEELGTLLVDKSSSLVSGIKLQTTLMGKTGELVGTFSEVEEQCGIKLATRRVLTFLGKPLSDEKLSGVICQGVDDKVFARPPQVAHGTIDIRHTFDTPLACTKLKGPLGGVSGALGKLVANLSGKALSPEGPPMLIHREGPPKVKAAARFVTDVCVPVSKKAWVLPKSVWRGEFFLDQIVGDEVLAAFGLGDLDKTTTELAPLLLDAARKRGRKQAGPMVQTVYMPAEDFPAEQRVSELHLPLD